MSLARKYRVQFAAPRGDRILFYLVTAIAFHAGAGAAGFVGWQEWQATAPEAIASTPIEFIYIDADDDASVENTPRRAQSNTKAQGEHRPNLPINAGKATAAPQKAILAEDASKPVNAATLNIPGEVRPAQNNVPPPASLTPPVEEAKAVTADAPTTPPPLVAPSLSTPVPTLPSEVVVSPSTISPEPEVDPAAQPFPLPEPPEVPSPQAISEAETLEASVPTESAPADATPASVTQPIAANTGLEGTPNPDYTNQDGPVQVAAQQDELRGAYAAQVNAQIIAQWERIPLDVSRQAIVRLEVDRLGNLRQVALTQPSGSAAADQAALEAVRNAAPFQAFNDEMTDERLGINMTFNYTIATPTTAATPSGREAAPIAAPHPQSE
ncbi:TonB family protein [Leptolyngbya sp. FACHB-16]|uniref:TonB family protein n=1 Tax=unclassified Leptolyngbya TaxID=2650499 RepID=UPI00168713C7|nr:TonB family protein [Leptolyngbya sp. FACHB-16]MBD2153406.1 TonB family protein [Leptolyngbya sp. FACHB-16]